MADSGSDSSSDEDEVREVKITSKSYPHVPPRVDSDWYQAELDDSQPYTKFKSLPNPGECM